MYIYVCSLKLLFDKHAHKAVAIVDSEGVSCLVDERSGRKVYRVKGQRSGDTYTVFPEHFCSCHSHFYDIVTKSEGVYVRGGGFCMWFACSIILCLSMYIVQCKHQIAIFLSDALERTRVKKVQGLVIAEILQDIN